MTSKILGFLRKSTWLSLKFIGFTLGGLLVVVLLSLIWNQFDEPIDPATQAWLDLPRSQNNHADNGYVQLMALGSAAAKPVEVAQALLNLEHQDSGAASSLSVHSNPKRDALSKQLDQVLPNQLAQLPNCKDDCYFYLKQHGAEIKKLAESESVLWARYQKLLAAPIFEEDLPTSIDHYLPRYFPAQKLGLIQLGLAIAELEEGQHEQAYQTWARHQRFWSKASEGSVSLLNLMIATHELNRGRDMLLQMLQDHPETVEQARLYALPVLAKPGALLPVLNHSLIHEYQNLTVFIIKMPDRSALLRAANPSSGEQNLRFEDRLFGLFLQRNATANLMRQRIQYQAMAQNKTATSVDALLSASAPSTNPCSGFGFSWLKNPVGKILTCSGDGPTYTEYYQRVNATEAKLQTVLQRLKSE